jgi:hypothetical protein
MILIFSSKSPASAGAQAQASLFVVESSLLLLHHLE